MYELLNLLWFVSFFFLLGGNKEIRVRDQTGTVQDWGGEKTGGKTAQDSYGHTG